MLYIHIPLNKNLIYFIQKMIYKICFNKWFNFYYIFIFNIYSTIFGNEIIKYFKLEEKFPSFAKFIQLRRKFQQYYFILNIILIIIII